MELDFYYDFDDEELKAATLSDVIAARIVFGSGDYGRLKNLLKGGEISVSSTVSNTALYNWLQRKGLSIYNKFIKSNWKMKKIIKDAMIKNKKLKFGWTILKGKGHYTSLDTGNETEDDSTLLILRDTPIEVIESIATGLCKEFHQESVMIVNYENNDSYLWGKRHD